jgi:hypothetical protein
MSREYAKKIQNDIHIDIKDKVNKDYVISTRVLLQSQDDIVCESCGKIIPKNTKYKCVKEYTDTYYYLNFCNPTCIRTYYSI